MGTDLGRRSSTKITNNNEVRKQMVKWLSKSGKWNDVQPGKKVNGMTSKAQSTAPLPSTPNTYQALHSANLDDGSESDVTQAKNDNGDSKIKLNSR